MLFLFKELCDQNDDLFTPNQTKKHLVEIKNACCVSSILVFVVYQAIP